MVVRPGAYVPAAQERAVAAKAAHAKSIPPASSTAHEPTPTLKPIVTKGREKDPIPFGGPPGPLRLFHVGLGDQAGWMLPFALFGLLGVGAARPVAGSQQSLTRRLAALLRAGRVVPGRGGGAEPVQGNRAPLLRLGAGTGHGSDGGSGRVALRGARARARHAPDLGPRADGLRGREHRGRAGRADAPRALPGMVHPPARGRSRRGRCARCWPCAAWRCRRSRSRSCCCSSRRPPTRPPPGWRRPRARSPPPDPGTTPAPAPTASTPATRASTARWPTTSARTIPARAGRC